MTVLSEVSHRPWPLPDRPWVMTQEWHDLLFAHWPIPEEVMAPLIPPGLTLDMFEGEAWVAVVPFHMRHVRPRFLPSAPWLSFFAELNVRTYVRAKDESGQDKPGVFFFSLDAANPIAVAIARSFYHLPYFRAQMDFHIHSGTQAVDYSSRRTHRGAPSAEFVGSYRPAGEVYQVAPGSLEHWLIERYCLYSADRRGHIYRGDIHHLPWPIQVAEAEFQVNSVAQAAGLTLPDCKPLLHFASRLEVVAWPIQQIYPTP
jgi:uncharacterized protein